MKLRALSLVLLAACVPAAAPTSPIVAVGPQYDTTHVYVAPDDVDAFAQSFLATFGGHTTKQIVATVTPTPSSTTSQLLQTPVGTISLFGFKTPVPAPFGTERNGYLVTDIDAAVASARAAGAAVIVEPFVDPIGKDAVVQWPGGVNMQLYWHTTKSSYAPLETVPDNRVYLSTDRADAFVAAFVPFAHAKVTSDIPNAPGAEIGRAEPYRRIRITSAFGNMVVIATNGHLTYPYGTENTGYAVPDLGRTLGKARASGVTVLVDSSPSAMVRFPGGYVAEIHASEHARVE